MRFLVDQCLSVELAEALTDAGHDVTHLRNLGMRRAKDLEVLELAQAEDRVLLSADTDFGALLAAPTGQAPRQAGSQRRRINSAMSGPRPAEPHHVAAVTGSTPPLVPRKGVGPQRVPRFPDLVLYLPADDR